MATIDNLNSLMVSNTSINSSVKNMSKLSYVINSATKNFNDFSTNMMDFSTNNNLIINMGNSLDQMNSKLAKSESGSKKAGANMFALAKSALSLGNITKGMEMVDQYTNSSNKLADVNDGLQTQMQLQNKVNAAANRSCISYSDMVNTVSGIGSLDTFSKDNDSAIGFAELSQKSLKLDESDLSLSDVTTSMSDGMISGDELSSIAGAGSTMGDALSSYTGKSSTQLDDMADQGLITANILKNAMFAASSDINTEFENQPKTFADIWTKITNSATNALSPIMQLVSDIMNSPAVQAGVNTIINALGFVSQVVSNLIGFVSDNWTKIIPILMAIGAYLLFIGATALIGIIQSMVGVIAAEMAAMAPILIIIGIIAAVIYILQAMGVSFEDIFGFIGGVVGVAVAGIWNLFLGLFDYILGIVSYLINPFINFANFFGNLFTSPISSIIYLFQSMADNVLGIIETVASAMDKVFGTNMADTVSGWRAGIKDMADAAVEKYAPDEDYQKVTDNLDLSSEDFGLSRMDYTEAFNNGKKTGKNIYGNIDGALSSLGGSDSGYDFDQFNTTGDALGTASDPLKVEGAGTNGSLDVNMEEEDLGYLRDMAERDYIANVATNTLAPNIAVSFGDVHETADVDKLFGRIQTILKEQIAITPEGVY
jgi:tape measure domain-containing protein